MHVEAALYSKSIAIIAKTADRLAQLDPSVFPTEASKDAKSLVQAILRSLGNAKFHEPMDKQVLFDQLIKLQALVEDLEASNSDHISWPLVRYWDHTWQSFFGDTGPIIFYTLTREHNYGISRYSEKLRLLVEPLLPTSELEKLFGGRAVYCLHLPSLEDDSLPLYANIGHEFGHAVFDRSEKRLLRLFAKNFDPVLKLLFDEVERKGSASTVKRRKERLRSIILALSEEMFCDLIGSVLGGPAFVLSLDEISWNKDRSAWTVVYWRGEDAIQAYPSFAFRLNCVKVWTASDDWEIEAKREFRQLSDLRLKELAEATSRVDTDEAFDYVVLTPETDKDIRLAQEALTLHLDALKRSLLTFCEDARSMMLADGALDGLPVRVDANEVMHLLRRLENSILPNIIPVEGKILGAPASFPAILNASAFYRLRILLEESQDRTSESVRKDLQKIDRMTGKALEVAYIQQQFNGWGGLMLGDPQSE